MKYVFKRKYYIFFISLFDTIGYFLKKFLSISKKNKSISYKKILVVRLDHIGDVLYSLPIFRNIKENNSNLKVYAFVSPSTAALLKNNLYIDGIILFDAPWFSRKKKKLKDKIVEIFNTIKILRKENFDLALELRGDLRNIIILKLSGIKYICGYGITGGGFLLTHETKYVKERNVLENNLDILKNLNMRVNSYTPAIFFNDDEIDWLEKFLAKNALKEKFLVGVHPFSGYPSKKWKEKNYNNLLKLINSKYDVKFLIFGMKNDLEESKRIIEDIEDVTFNLTGKTTLRETILLINKCNVFIGNDSGPSHIAYCLGIPTIIIFSGTNRKEKWTINLPNLRIIEKDIDCKGCEKEICDKGNMCIERIEIEEVFDEFKNLVGKYLDV